MTQTIDEDAFEYDESDDGSDEDNDDLDDEDEESEIAELPEEFGRQLDETLAHPENFVTRELRRPTN